MEFQRGKPMAHRNRSFPLSESQTSYCPEVGKRRPHPGPPTIRLTARNLAIPKVASWMLCSVAPSADSSNIGGVSHAQQNKNLEALYRDKR